MPGANSATGELFNLFQSRCKMLPRIYAQELDVDISDIEVEINVKIETKTLSLKPVENKSVEFESTKSYQFSLRVLAAQIQEWKSEDYDVTLICATDAEKNRLSDCSEQKQTLMKNHTKFSVKHLKKLEGKNERENFVRYRYRF